MKRPHAKGRMPRDVVFCAYEAANKGQFKKAKEYVSPKVLKMIAAAHAKAVTTGRKLRRLKKLYGDDEYLQLTSDLNKKVLEGTNFKNSWDDTTHKRTLVKIETTRQVIQNTRATVYLKLSFKDGSVLKDNETLVFYQGRWLLG
jgi:hypothetical protein